MINIIQMFKKMNKIISILIIVILLCAGCSARRNSGGETLSVRYFYLNVCASCNEQEEFFKRFEALTGISRNAMNLDINTYNVYNSYDMSVYERTMEELGLDAGAYTFPLLLVGDEIIKDSDAEEFFNEGEFPLSLPRPEFAIPPGASAILYFYAPGCGDCDKAGGILDGLPAVVTLGAVESPVHVLRVSVADSWGISLFRTYCEAFAIPQEKQKVPAVFVGYAALMGLDEIEGTSAALAAGNGRSTPMIKADPDLGALTPAGFAADIAAGPAAGDGRNNAGGFSVLGALLTGFINGLNPCSISMLLMLLSLLAVKSKWIAPVGAAYLSGKFAGFLLLGTVLYNSLNSLRLSGVRSILNIVLIVFASVMILLNINDIAAAVKQDYGKIKLQLPRKLRSFNHKIINKTASLKSPAALAAGAAALGAAVSAGEFLCTGQIYVAMIINTINAGIGGTGAGEAGAGEAGAAFWLLALYSAAFVAPPAILIILIGKGKKLFDVSEFFRERLVWIKLFNIAVFAAVIVFIFI